MELEGTSAVVESSRGMVTGREEELMGDTIMEHDGGLTSRRPCRNINSSSCRCQSRVNRDGEGGNGCAGGRDRRG